MVRNIILQLILYKGIGPVLVAKLCSVIGYDQLGVLKSLAAADFVERFNLSPREALMVHTALRDDEALVAHEKWCLDNNVQAILLGDAEYPKLLSHIGAPPAVLWVKGRIPVNESSCALVGSRDANYYGKRVVQLLVPALVSQEIVTVSGGARGIDAWVHDETIKAGGKTVAVMGCGLAHTYPAENADLFSRIVESGGALVSPFEPSQRPLPGSFPARNRIIAGLASACIVIQAAAKSGALITATHALEENREVGAVPGPIDDRLSVGVNDLIAQGAKIIVDGVSAVELCGKTTQKIIQEKQCVIVDACEATVLELLNTAKTFDELLEHYEGTSVALQEQLFELQLTGKVKQNHAGLWVRI